MLLSLNSIGEFLKFWSPFLTAGGLVYGAYRKTKKSISTWANTLMNNHMSHLQSSLNRIDQSQTQQLEYLTVQTDNLKEQTILLHQISTDLRPSAIPAKRGKYRSVKIKS